MSGYLYKIFGRSPLNTLQAHMNKATHCAERLLAFFDAVIPGDWAVAEQMQQLIIADENEADVIKKEIRTHLPKGLFLPVSKHDLLETLIFQDKIANTAKDIAGLIIGRKMQLPEILVKDYQKFLNSVLETVRKANQASLELDQLLETGFSGNEVTVIENIISEIRDLEHQSDEYKISVRQHLFAIEKQLSPIDVIFLYKMIDWTGEIADHAQRVGNRLELLMAK